MPVIAQSSVFTRIDRDFESRCIDLDSVGPVQATASDMRRKKLFNYLRFLILCWFGHVNICVMSLEGETTFKVVPQHCCFKCVLFSAVLTWHKGSISVLFKYLYVG